MHGQSDISRNDFDSIYKVQKLKDILEDRDAKAFANLQPNMNFN